MNKFVRLSSLTSVLSLGFSTVLAADQFHYNNALVGERAMGLGGAYCAVSDDASGVVYNPAGLAFALSNDISGSATVPFSSKKVEYLKTIGDKSFEEHSQGKFSPFVGSLLKLDHIMPGLVFAFGLWTSDAELKDQNDKIVDLDLRVQRFHRTVNLRASTDYIGAAVAKRFGSTMSLGFGVNSFSTDELLQEYQDAVTGTGPFQILTQNTRQHLTVSGIEPVLGMQMVFGRLTTGLTIKVPILTSQLFETDFERHRFIVDSSLTVPAENNTVERIPISKEEKDPLGNWPAEYRFGTALFASTTTLWTLDVSHRTKTDGVTNAYDRLAVTNFGTGFEWYATSSFPVRFGYFTNYDSRPKINKALTDQQDNIDYQGASLFLGWVQPNSSVSFGGVYQTGAGEAQKIGGVTNVQKVKAGSYALAYSASHNF